MAQLSNPTGSSSESQLVSLVGGLYDAVAAGDQAWQTFLARCCEQISAASAVFVVDNRIVGAHSVDPAYIASYARYYASRNIYVLRARTLAKPAAIVRGQELCPDSELEKSEYYNDYLRPQDIYHSLAALLQKDGNQLAHLGFVRPRRKGYFDEHETNLLDLLTPHLQTALRLREKLVLLEERNAALLEILDRLPFGVFLVDAACAVIESNRAATLLVNKCDGLRIAGRELAAASPRDNLKLQRNIEAALRIYSGTSTEPCGLVTIARPSGRRSFVACIAPLRELNIPRLGRAVAAAVFISDPDAQDVLDSRIWSACFSLTPAEKRLAELLVLGRSLKESAERLQVSANTAKTQLKSIMAKTATHHQKDLIRVLLSLQIGHLGPDGSPDPALRPPS